MSCMTKCLGRLCVTLKVIALITNLIALGLPYWYKGAAVETVGVNGSDNVKTTIREGLWKACTDVEYLGNTNSYCVGNDASTVVIVIRWLLMVASGIVGIAILASGAAHLESNKTAFIVGAIHAFISAALNATSAALYATVVKDDIGFQLEHLFIGWGLNFLSMASGLLGGLLALCLARMVSTAKVDDLDKDTE
ncbi:uncharacterized protein LOC128207199 [Mya arenaria]|uniref:uncharacterized protein LOC128207199 n=1 Tax=Mya arenaria TaxID=6604 RepID=UPI0022E69C29|nr:uncharacterized protein LOC128207199 [Mya arenaria]